MEEKKTLKIKKPYLIIFALAIAFAIMGFIDLKVNAADDYAVNVQYITHGYNGSGNEIETRATDLGSIVSSAPIDAYYYTSYDKPVATNHKYTVFLVSEQPMTDNDVQTTLNGTTVYICMFGPVNAGLYYDGGGYLEPLISGNRYSYDLNTDYSDISAFATALSSNTLDCEQIIDYSQLQIDDNMTTIKNLKRNVIEVHNNKNSVFPSSLYDYLTWDNDMVESWELELQFVPVVQYYDINLAKNTFVKEFIGDWYSKEIFTGVRNAYLNMCFDVSNAEYITNNPEIYNFYADCEEKYEKGFFEESYLYFGYRFRYIDKANLKCSPWVVLMPSHTKDSYVVTVEYADNTTSDVGSGDGVHNKYENLENIEDAIVDVESENKFRDEYGITDSEINVDEAKTWLDTVSEFIKGTPQFIGATLSFLPKPVLYGMYVCVFMSVVAVAVAIFKALI